MSIIGHRQSWYRSAQRQYLRHRQGNTSTLESTVNPETCEAQVNGELLTCEPASELPMAQR